jgi:hypothetical protein
MTMRVLLGIYGPTARASACSAWGCEESDWFQSLRMVEWKTRNAQDVVGESPWEFDSPFGDHADVVKWQTRCPEVAVGESPWRFDSSRRQ